MVYRYHKMRLLVRGRLQKSFSAEINEEVVEFYTSINVIFGSDLKECRQNNESISGEKFVDGDFFIKTLEESGLEGEKLVNACSNRIFKLRGKYRTNWPFYHKSFEYLWRIFWSMQRTFPIR